MTSTTTYGNRETAWCPGCGNFSIRTAVTGALEELGLAPHEVCFSSGIGQAAKAPHYINVNYFNGLHGRSLPPAQAIKLSNPGLTVIAESGDGCFYGEGGNHFLAAVRRNVDMTMLAHDNQIYGLTKGQASPTTFEGQKTKAQPFGSPSMPFNPVAVAVTMKASFVARGFSGDVEQLKGLIKQAVQHKGFALVDILQPCVSFNKVNTFAWYKEHAYTLDAHDPTDWEKAIALANEFGERIPLGVIYKNDRATFSSHLPTTSGPPLALRKVDRKALQQVMESYG